MCTHPLTDSIIPIQQPPIWTSNIEYLYNLTDVPIRCVLTVGHSTRRRDGMEL